MCSPATVLEEIGRTICCDRLRTGKTPNKQFTFTLEFLTSSSSSTYDRVEVRCQVPARSARYLLLDKLGQLPDLPIVVLQGKRAVLESYKPSSRALRRLFMCIKRLF